MKQIGFIGLGAMGRHVAANLLKAGYALKVYDLNAAAVNELVEKGAEAAGCAREVAQGSEIVMTMLPNSPHVEAAMTGPDGILAGLQAGGVIIDLTTLAPGEAKRLCKLAAESGVTMLDAPVSGGVAGAEAGTLTLFVGGEEATFQKMMPVFEAIGKTIRLLGDSGAGQTVKMVNQIMVGLEITALAEAWTLGVKAGADPEVLCDVLGTGAAACKQMEIIRRSILQGNYEPGFAVNLQYKDLGIAMETSRELQVPMLLTSTAVQYFEMARARGYGGKDHSAVAKVLEDITGVDISAAKKK